MFRREDDFYFILATKERERERVKREIEIKREGERERERENPPSPTLPDNAVRDERVFANACVALRADEPQTRWTAITFYATDAWVAPDAEPVPDDETDAVADAWHRADHPCHGWDAPNANAPGGRSVPSEGVLSLTLDTTADLDPAARSALARSFFVCGQELPPPVSLFRLAYPDPNGKSGDPSDHEPSVLARWWGGTRAASKRTVTFRT